MKIDFSFSSNWKRASIWLRVESPFPIGTTKNQHTIGKPPENILFELASLILYINMVMTMSLHLVILFHGVRVFIRKLSVFVASSFHRRLRVRVMVTEDGSHSCHTIEKFYSYGRKGENSMRNILIAFYEIPVNIGKLLKSTAMIESIYSFILYLYTYFTVLLISHIFSFSSSSCSNYIALSFTLSLFLFLSFSFTVWPHLPKCTRSICRCSIKICSHIWLAQLHG